MTAAAVTSGALVVSTAGWTLMMLRAGAEIGDGSALLIGLALWVAAITGMAGLLLVRARWARRLIWGVVAAQAVLAARLEVDVWWMLALALTALAGLGALGPFLDGFVRRRPGSGPPGRAIGVPLVLIATTYGIGILDGANPAGLAVGLTALLAAFWFIRTFDGALLVVRLLWPLGALVGAAAMPFPALLAAAAGAVTVATLAWHPSVRNSVRPLTTAGSTIPIPPELAPGDVLDAADIDDRGRPR